MIDISKQYRTRDGREVKLLMDNGGGTNPIIGAIKGYEDIWVATRWFVDGRWDIFMKDCPNDLIEVKPRIKREAWVNVYAAEDTRGAGLDLSVEAAEDKEMADEFAEMDSKRRIACVKIEIDVEEGHGL